MLVPRSQDGPEPPGLGRKSPGSGEPAGDPEVDHRRSSIEDGAGEAVLPCRRGGREMAFDDGGTRTVTRRAMGAEMLDAETELELARAWRDDRDEKALHRLVNAYMRLAISMAARYRRYGAPMPDLIQEAGVGLMKAAEKFDPDRGVRFSTYAVWWIKASIQDYVMRNWSMVQDRVDLVAEGAVLQPSPCAGPARARGGGERRGARRPPAARDDRRRGRRAAARRRDDGRAARRCGLLAQRPAGRRGGPRVAGDARGRGAAGRRDGERGTRTWRGCADGWPRRCGRSARGSG